MFDVQKYWNKRYIGAESKKGYASGYGSDGNELKFKIDFVSSFMQENNIRTLCDYGCGSGNFVLSLPKIYDQYIAFDISENAINICNKRIKNKENLIFTSNIEDCNRSCHLGLSIDVLFHQIDLDDLNKYLSNLFRHKYVIIYTTDYEKEYNPEKAAHVIRRNFSNIIEKNYTNYSLLKRELYLGNKDQKVFLVYQKKDNDF